MQIYQHSEAQGDYRDLKFVYIEGVQVFDPAMFVAVSNYPDGPTVMYTADGGTHRLQIQPQRLMDFLAPHIRPVLAFTRDQFVTYVVRDCIEGYRMRQAIDEVELRFQHSTSVMAPVSPGALEAILEESCGSITRIVVKPEEKPKPFAPRSTHLRVRILREWGYPNDLLQERYVRTLPPEDVANLIANGVAVLAPEGGEAEETIAEFGWNQAKARGFKMEVAEGQ